MKEEHKFRFELGVSQKIAALLQTIAKGLYLLTEENSPDSYLMKIAAYIEKHYAEPIHIADLSQSFAISQNQLIRTFQAEFGYTPYEYLKKHRLLKACELLQMTEYPVEEIGEMTGFRNSSNFIFQFKRQYHITPKAYRKQYSPFKANSFLRHKA
ncbi:HTH-type transcriptional activator RhaS [bioreactor metagenome]|uniref:HTH-type transcriptional activator RhaS n=1 Tax=bioreactor metagenome TaxID=1076179 RepID=A0A645J8D2_9ZZZZ